jgi:hypothetical protein
MRKGGGGGALIADLGEGEGRIGSCDAVVASQRCLEASSETRAVDSGDFGFAWGGGLRKEKR